MKLYNIIFFFICIAFLNCNINNNETPENAKEFIISNEEIEISSKLWFPEADKYPVIIVVPEDIYPKEQFSTSTKVFLENGIGVIAYDKRGTFKSSGDAITPTIENSKESIELMSSDLLALVSYLKSMPNIDPKKIGLFCTGEGSWICSKAQALDSQIALSVNIVGSSTSFGIQKYYSQLSGNDLDGNNLSEYSILQIDSLVNNYSGPSGFDPFPDLKSISTPQLWILGELDFKNPTRQSVLILNELIFEYQKEIDLLVVG